MSLVENLINQISTAGSSNISKPQSFDMGDDTFAQLLAKQLENTEPSTPANSVGMMGQPAGLFIEPIDGVEFSETIQDQLESIGEKKISREDLLNEPIEIKDIDLSDFFSNLIKTATDNNSDFMNFARKQATNFYNQHSKNLVLDTKEFVQDILTT